MNNTQTKICKTCKHDKSLVEYAKNKNCKDGHLTECKECNKIYRKENAKHRAEVEKKRRRKNGVKPKKIFATDEERRVTHLDSCKRWQQNNKDKVDEYNTQYRKMFRDKCNERIRKWKKANPHKVAEYTERRGGYTIWAKPPWVDNELLKTIYIERDQLTKETGTVHQVDHYYPILGKNVCGLHVAENLQVITKDENLAKSNIHPDEFY